MIHYTSLTSVVLPASVNSLGTEVFGECTQLKELIIADSSKELKLGTSILRGVPLENLYLGRDVTYPFNDSPFYKKATLTQLTIGNNVTSLGKYIFSECSGLTSVTIPKSVNSVGYYAFSSCTALTELIIENGLSSIGNLAFTNCRSLESLTLPNSVTTIGTEAFNSCISLKRISIADGENKLNCWPDIFKNVNMESLYLGRNFTCDNYRNSNKPFYNKASLSQLIIGEKVTEIGKYDFYGCSGLENFEFPHSVSKIGESSFEGCCSLTSLTIPNSIISIGDAAFKDCTGLKHAIVEDDSQALRCGNIFEGVDLDTVYLGRNMTAFTKMTTISSLTISEFVTEIYDYQFSGCSRLTSIQLPNSLTIIGDYAFSECVSLSSVIIPNSVITIGYSAFSQCRSLKSVSLPNVRSIGGEAFDGCSEITAIYYNTDDPIFSTAKYFKDVYDTATLYVPSGTVMKCRATYPWAHFLKIRPYDFTTRVEDASRDYESGIPYEIYNLKGEKMMDCIEDVPSGVYILRQGKKTKKVILKNH